MLGRVAASWLGCEDHACTLVAVTCLLYVISQNSATRMHRKCHSNYYNYPKCVDHPDGYSCSCGPAFRWNTRMCVALGVDSRFEFYNTTPVRYTLLLGKAFPELKSFTISMWLKTNQSQHNGTVMSYKHLTKYNLFRIMSGSTLSFDIHEKEIKTDIKLNESAWTHLAWTWSSQDGSWNLYLNAHRVLRGRSAKAKKVVPGGGELVLGQSSRTPESHNTFDTDTSFLGEMAFVNIWHRVMNLTEIRTVFNDCIHMQCGDAVEWVDFRSGTRGSMRIRWPAKVKGDQECYTDREYAHTCDKHCSDVIGAQCNMEIVENVRWRRTKADKTEKVLCPGMRQDLLHITGIGHCDDCGQYAKRSCHRTRDNNGVWGKPNMDDCMSERELELKRQISSFVLSDKFNESKILELATELSNRTNEGKYHNPVDISTIIDCIDWLLQAQGITIKDIPWTRGKMLRLAQSHVPYPSYEETRVFAETIATVVDNLVYKKNDVGWIATQPPGAEGDELMKTVNGLMSLITKSLMYHMKRGDISYEQASISALRRHVAFKIKVYRSEDVGGTTFPDNTDVLSLGINDFQGSVTLPQETIDALNTTTLPDYVGLSTARFSVAKILPNHDLLTKSKENIVNSALFSLLVHLDDQRLNNLSRAVRVQLQYLDNFNISNPECVSLDHGNRSKQWQWTRTGCFLVTHDVRGAICECSHPGIFAVTTDMYDVNWNKDEKPTILMEIPSYIGCAVSALLCLISFVMLIYLRTSSKTAAVHKNLALSIVCSQLTFMCGIDRIKHQVVCHVFAISFHYFFLATYSWMMNEAFNLYITITYAAHAHGEHPEASSQWRYYILGWIIPGVLVGAFFGTHTDDYYAPDMCWIAWKYVWLFLGPAIGLIAITVLVLIFTAKEHHETSYAKNEKTNKMILIHTKALWTQAILITLCWSFAFLSIKKRGSILKYLYAMFNCLQGAFFLVFFFLLNDEVIQELIWICFTHESALLLFKFLVEPRWQHRISVRSLHKRKKKKKNMAKHGYMYSSTQSIDSDGSGNEMNEIDNQGQQSEEPGEGPANASNNKPKNGAKPKRSKPKSQIEASSDEGSDCEIMVTSV